MSVKDICKAVGYYDTSGFIRRFRRYLAITPLQYRNNARRKKQ
jgi:AraC-like DNA-binding protein